MWELKSCFLNIWDRAKPSLSAFLSELEAAAVVSLWVQSGFRPLQNFGEDPLGPTRCVRFCRFLQRCRHVGGGAEPRCCNPEPKRRQIPQFAHEQTPPRRWTDLHTCTPAVRAGFDHFGPSKQKSCSAFLDCSGLNDTLLEPNSPSAFQVLLTGSNQLSNCANWFVSWNRFVLN